MLSRSYLIDLTKTFGSINKIFGRVKKTIQAKTLVDLSKRVWLTGQKFGRLSQNVLWNQPNIVNQTILLDEPFFFLSVQHIVESAPRPNAVSRAVAATTLSLCYCHVAFILAYWFLNFCLYFYSLIPVWKREGKRKIYIYFFYIFRK